MSDKISEHLGLEPYEKPLEGEVMKTVNENDEDYETARDSILEVIETGRSAMKSIEDLAEQSESMRAYEVLSTMMKTVLDSNKQLTDLKHKREEKSNANKDKGKGENKDPQNTVKFTGTTAELQKMINKEKNNE